jgi:hypothetical protein
MRTWSSFLIALVAAGAVLVGSSSGAPQPSLTAQSVQVNVEGLEQAYEIGGEQVWAYDWSSKPAAVAAFDTYFTLTITGSPNDAQIETGKHQAFQDNKCNFWHGTALAPVTTSWSGGSKSVTATPKAPGQYDAGTGWTMTETTPGGVVEITLSNIFVASESYVLKGKGKSKWDNKFSFTMTTTGVDEFGSEITVSRLNGLTIELLKDGEVLGAITPDHTVQFGADWYYEANGGVFGNPLVQGDLLSDDMVSNILLADNFAGNDGVGGERAMVDDITLPVIAEAGTYCVRISGVIKGNSFICDEPFEVTGTLVVIGGCD